MQSLKKAFRLLCLSLLILLASIGISIGGGMALPLSRKREDESFHIELLESDKVHPNTATEEMLKL